MQTQEHKRFAVFAYCDYYPGGGIYDIEASFDTEVEAIEFATNIPMKGLYGVDNVYIFDFETRRIVWDVYKQGEKW